MWRKPNINVCINVSLISNLPLCMVAQLFFQVSQLWMQSYATIILDSQKKHCVVWTSKLRSIEAIIPK